MVNKHEEMFNILRDVQMKITMRLSHSVRMAGIGKQRERNAGDDAGNKEPLSMAWCHYYGSQNGGFSKS